MRRQLKAEALRTQKSEVKSVSAAARKQIEAARQQNSDARSRNAAGRSVSEAAKRQLAAAFTQIGECSSAKADQSS